MGTFVRVTLVVAVAIVIFAALILLLKLLAIAAVVAIAAIGVGFVVRGMRRRLAASRPVRVTTLTARR